ncbi:MAG: glycine C-acetyltransferase, partial [Roseibacillus sp.]|nr:glycine C-acetyltransferase [Roseibacillus sp.]
MFSTALQSRLHRTLKEIKQAGLYKQERFLGSSQSALITLQDGREVLNMCANNYLGLADHPEVVEAARAALERWG